MKGKLDFTWRFNEPFRFFLVFFDRYMWNVIKWDLQLGWLQICCHHVKKETK